MGRQGEAGRDQEQEGSNNLYIEGKDSLEGGVRAGQPWARWAVTESE